MVEYVPQELSLCFSSTDGSLQARAPLKQVGHILGNQDAHRYGFLSLWRDGHERRKINAVQNQLLPDINLQNEHSIRALALLIC